MIFVTFNSCRNSTINANINTYKARCFVFGNINLSNAYIHGTTNISPIFSLTNPCFKNIAIKNSIIRIVINIIKFIKTNITHF